jgi:exopolyphosphatase/pppGpp-phosphohydrolase
MTEGREDVIVGGVLVLAVVMASFGRDRCLVSEDDILDGLARGLLMPTLSPDAR